MADKEAAYLVLAPEGITSGVGRHAAGDTVYESDLDGMGAKLSALGLVVREAADGVPPDRGKRNGVPDWNAAATATASGEPAEVPAGEMMPELAPPNDPTYSPPAITAEELAAVAEPTALHADADATAVAQLPAPAVLRFVQENPGRLDDVLAAEHGRVRPRQSVIDALKAKGTTQPMPETSPAKPTVAPATTRKKAATRRPTARKR